MLKYLRQHGEQGQTAILLALSMIGLLGIVGLALDGGMLYWNQRRAQNGADAAAIAGVTKLVEHIVDENCASGSEQEVLSYIHEYADVNEIPDVESGENVEAVYLIETSSGDRVPLIYSGTGQPWRVGETGSIPCDQDPVGLRVKARFPQRTFLAGIIGIAKTNVTVDASATFETQSSCRKYVLLALSDDPNQNTLHLSGSIIHITGGGLHSNGGTHIQGSDPDIDPSQPIEYGDGATGNISDRVENPDRIGEAPPVSGDGFYRYADFESGYIYQRYCALDCSKIYFINRDLDGPDVVQDGKLKDGLYIVTGDVKLSASELDRVYTRTSNDRPWRVTIAAQGCVQFSGGNNTLPYAAGVLIYTDCSNTSQGAVKMSGSENHWAGLIIAKNGSVDVSGSDNVMTGMIVSNSISESGSNNQFQHHPDYCPAQPPTVLLTQ